MDMSKLRRAVSEQEISRSSPPSSVYSDEPISSSPAHSTANPRESLRAFSPEHPEESNFTEDLEPESSSPAELQESEASSHDPASLPAEELTSNQPHLPAEDVAEGHSSEASSHDPASLPAQELPHLAVEDVAEVAAEDVAEDGDYELTPEQEILNFLQNTQSEFQREIESGKEDMTIPDFQQNVITPLLTLIDLCNTRELPTKLRDGLIGIIDLCQKDEHTGAQQAYFNTAIGKAAWLTSENSYIWQDDETRDFLQAFKRLLSFCERRHGSK